MADTEGDGQGSPSGRRLGMPPFLRGKGRDSGSAQLAVIIALQHRGEDVLCIADHDRCSEMFDEVVATLGASGIDMRVSTGAARGAARIVYLPNASRLVFRPFRRDGAGVRGQNPIAVWIDSDDHRAQVEAVELIKRTRDLTVGVDCG